MTYRGRVQKGRVVLDDLAQLAEGAQVTVSLVVDATAADDESLPTLYEQCKSFIGIAKGLPCDLALNHDHYLHGLPKR